MSITIRRGKKRASIGEYLGSLWQASLDLVFPSPMLCLVCGKKLARGMLVQLCQACLEQLPLVGESFCQLCGRPSRPSSNVHCLDCTGTKHFFLRNRAVGIYGGPLKEQIQEFKYHYNRRLCIGLGEVMGLVARQRGWIPKDAHLVAVPLHKERLEERGYNQAELLIQGIERVLPVSVLKRDCVIRRAATGASSKLGPRERRANLRGVFQVPRAGEVAGKVLCIIDDIYTTGATLDEMARTLLMAGAEAVYGLTLAIAVDDQDLLGRVQGSCGYYQS